ncbi:MAG: HPr family phosphocarrier protein [Proteobacteria bacterium]|nr:HPr family phosphocarrier protein [Pseudomonadota bacterium]
MTKTLILTYPCGLHARPCTALAALIKPFSAKVILVHNGERAHVSSVLEMLSMGIQSGSEIIFEAEGNDAEKVLQEIGNFIHTLNTKEHW